MAYFCTVTRVARTSHSSMARDGGDIGDYGRPLLAAVPRLAAKAGVTGNTIAQNNGSWV
jgi:hypothetical protein